MSDALPDVEGAVRTWLRTQASVTNIVGQRIFFGIPRNAKESTYPLVTVQRVGGADDTSDAPLDIAVLQLDCWGAFDDAGNGKKADVVALMNAVRSVCRDVRQATAFTQNVRVFGITVQSVAWVPDPESDRPRYSVTVEVTAIHT